MQPARTNVEDVPFWLRSVTLGRIRDGIVTYTQSAAAKREALSDVRPRDVFFVAWTGQYKTDIFAVADPQSLLKSAPEGTDAKKRRR